MLLSQQPLERAVDEIVGPRGSGSDCRRGGPRSGDVPTQRCTVHKHRNLLAHALQRLHDEVSADYNEMIYAASPAEIEQRRRAVLI